MSTYRIAEVDAKIAEAQGRIAVTALFGAPG